MLGRWLFKSTCDSRAKSRDKGGPPDFLPEFHVLISRVREFLYLLPCLKPGWEDAGSAEEFPQILLSEGAKTTKLLYYKCSVMNPGLILITF